MTVPALLVNLLKRGYKTMSTWQLAGAYYKVHSIQRRPENKLNIKKMLVLIYHRIYSEKNIFVLFCIHCLPSQSRTP